MDFLRTLSIRRRPKRVFEEITHTTSAGGGEKYSCIFLTSRWFMLTNLLFVSKCLWGLILGVHPGRLNQCGRSVLLYVKCILVKMLGHILFKNAIFVCMYDIERQAVGLSHAWRCCRYRLASWTDQIRITSLACICPANDPGPEWHYAVLQHYCMLQFAHTGHFSSTLTKEKNKPLFLWHAHHGFSLSLCNALKPWSTYPINTSDVINSGENSGSQYIHCQNIMSG